jgi:DNA-binding transcriptional MerR regulator
MVRLFLALLFLYALVLPRPAAAQDIHVIVIVGAGGDEERSVRFHKWAAAVVDGAKKRGIPEANITYLGEQVERDPARIRARATKENVTTAFQETLKRSKPADELFVLLIGHGSFDGRVGAFNLMGPDLSAGDYDLLLDQFKTQRISFVNTASASGAFVKELAGPARTIVAATRTGGERNETRFPEFFVEALEGETADRDRNGRISVLEAFDYAASRVKETYEKQGHLLTEHATLDDGNEGKFAATQFLSPRGSRAAGAAAADPALRALLEQRDELEEQIAQLRLKKDSMDAAKYEQELEKLLTDLALKTRSIRELEAKK